MPNGVIRKPNAAEPAESKPLREKIAVLALPTAAVNPVHIVISFVNKGRLDAAAAVPVAPAAAAPTPPPDPNPVSVPNSFPISVRPAAIEAIPDIAPPASLALKNSLPNAPAKSKMLLVNPAT